MTQESLVRSLGLKEAAALVVGTVVGTGVFIQAASMAQNAGSATWVIAAWVVGGLVSLCGALCYGELGGMFPKAGGDYVFLKEAYGDGVAFLFGWIRFLIVSPGSIAAYAVGAATFLSGPLGLTEGWMRPAFAAGSVALFALINCMSVAVGGRIQGALTVLKIVLILGLSASIFLSGNGSVANLSTWTGSSGGGFPGWTGFGAALIAALFAYDGWNFMPMAAGEIKDPGKNIPRALAIGMAGVLAIYCLANLSYFYALPASEIANAFPIRQDALPTATLAAKTTLGDFILPFLSVLFSISAFGALNGAVLTTARVPFAMARDGLFPRKLGEVSHTTRVPIYAVAAQSAVAILLALSGTFQQLTVAVVFSSWTFYGLGALAVVILRKKSPNVVREFKTPFYPWLPIVFFVAAVLILTSALATSPFESGLGVVFTLLGIPVYLWFRARSKRLPA